MCLLEGTNLSEGRGTTRPFEIFGAPFIESERLIKRLKDFKLSGVVFRPVYFDLTFQKFAGQICGGSQIYVINRERFKPFKTAFSILKMEGELIYIHSSAQTDNIELNGYVSIEAQAEIKNGSFLRNVIDLVAL